MALGAGLNRVQTSETDPSSSLLVWDSEPLALDLDVVSSIEVQFDAVSTAADTAWVAFLQDVDAAGIVTDVTTLLADRSPKICEPEVHEFSPLRHASKSRKAAS